MLLFSVLAAMAQKHVNDSIWKSFDMNEVVVTGTRTQKFLMDAPVQTRVITSRDIAKTDATNIKDLLQQELPGLEFSYAMNHQVHLNFSGFGGQSVLFLIDGERLAGETMDDVDFSRLSMDNVERIEIVKGAASALYGSNASGGVINIITKEASKPFSLNVNARLAKHNEQRYGGTMGINANGFSNVLSINHNSVDNYDVHSAPNPKTRGIINTVYGDKTWNVKEQLSYSVSSQLKLTGRAGYFFREVVRAADQPERYRDFSGGLKGVWYISDNDNIELSYSFDQYDKSDYQCINRLDIRDYSNVRNSVRALYSHSFGNGDILTLGSDYMYDYLMNKNLLGTTREESLFDVFAQYDWIVNDKWEVVGVLRYDGMPDRGENQLTPKVSARYSPMKNMNVRFGYGIGYRPPMLKEKYYNFDMTGIWIIEGNPDLVSEISHNFNASVDYTKGHYNVAVTAYYNDVRNKLATSAPYYKSPSDKLPYLPYANLAAYKVYGGDVSLQTHWDNGLSAKLSYAYTCEKLPKDKSGKQINNQYIPARPHSLTWRLDYDHRFSKGYSLSASLSGRYLSPVDNMEFIDYYDITKGTVTISYPDYSMWKLSLMQRFGKHVTLNVAVDNILNYKPRYYYLNCPLTDGANLMVGVGVQL